MLCECWFLHVINKAFLKKNLRKSQIRSTKIFVDNNTCIIYTHRSKTCNRIIKITGKPRPEAHMDMILFEVYLKSNDLIPQQQILQRHYLYIIDNVIALSDLVESCGYSWKTLQKGSCPYGTGKKKRYRQKETPQLFSWEFSCNQLAHRESIACNWL